MLDGKQRERWTHTSHVMWAAIHAEGLRKSAKLPTDLLPDELKPKPAEAGGKNGADVMVDLGVLRAVWVDGKVAETKSRPVDGTGGDADDEYDLDED